MNESQLTDFTRRLAEYFQKHTGSGPEIGVPRPLDEKLELLEYSGLIGISGKHRGCLCFSASRAMLERLGTYLVPGDSLDEDLLTDLSGEIANTLAGNAQRIFGPGFHISVPMMMGGHSPEIVLRKMRQPIYLIPLFWDGAKAVLIIGVDD